MFLLFLFSALSAANAGIISADPPVLAAIEASYKQTGLENNVNDLSRYLANNYINRNIVLRDISGLYVIYRNQCVKFDAKPFSFEVRPDNGKIEWKMDF